MADQSIYTVGGTVQAGGGVYIPRKADDELLKHCRASEFAFILSSRQVGKSSLMVRTSEQLEKDGICSVIIDLSRIGVKISVDEWYLGILDEISSTLKLQTDIFVWWSEHAGLSPSMRMTNFFRDVLLKEVIQPVVLFFDEIDSTLSIPFTDDFFASLRAIYNARSTVEEFKRLSFVMIGVATPSDLISDDKRTPFNIGYRVDLTDFTPEEALPLAGKLGSQALGWVFHWTGGHPYLTQRLCAHLSKLNWASEIQEEDVASAVKQLFEGEQGQQENNLQFVRDMLTKRAPDIQRVLKTYKDVRSGKRVLDDERSIAKAHLKLSGLVRSEQGALRVRNRIYNSTFNLQWVNENIPKNWLKITTLLLGIMTFSLLSIFIYDYAIGIKNEQYRSRIYGSDPSVQLETLARIFDLRGILPNSDYDSSAREVYFSLKANEQEALFKYSFPDVKKKYLPTVVRGLYVAMANVEGSQDSTSLLQIMRDSLRGVDDNLYNEIDSWLLARNSSTNIEALTNYNRSIKLNGDNPATHYERANIEIELGLYKEAMADLDQTMALAQNLSTEAAEKDMPTPSPLPTLETFIGDPSLIFTPTVSTQLTEEISVIPLPTLSQPAIQTTIPIQTQITNQNQAPTPEIGTESDLQYPPILQESYRSNFYSRAYIRSAVDVLLQKIISISEVRLLLMEENKYPNLASNGLLPDIVLTPDATETIVSIAIFTDTSVPTDSLVVTKPTSTTVPPTQTMTPSGPPPEINSHGALMILVPAGKFQMGAISSDLRALGEERPLHEVQLDAYYIDKYEVTNALYKVCVDAGECDLPIREDPNIRDRYFGIQKFDLYPVVNVNWDMAQTYCEWRGARLPTEAEWEKAARGDVPRLYPWEGTEFSCQFANYNQRCVYGTTQVGVYESGKSPYGLYDMAGNVWEWVSDWYSQDYYGISFLPNPPGPVYGQAKVARGGSWASGDDDIRTSKRLRYPPGYSNFDLGFRCAMSVPK